MANRQQLESQLKENDMVLQVETRMAGRLKTSHYFINSSLANANANATGNQAYSRGRHGQRVQAGRPGLGEARAYGSAAECGEAARVYPW